MPEPPVPGARGHLRHTPRWSLARSVEHTAEHLVHVDGLDDDAALAGPHVLEQREDEVAQSLCPRPDEPQVLERLGRQLVGVIPLEQLGEGGHASGGRVEIVGKEAGVVVELDHPLFEVCDTLAQSCDLVSLHCTSVPCGTERRTDHDEGRTQGCGPGRVPPLGLEPRTCGLRVRRSNQLS